MRVKFYFTIKYLYICTIVIQLIDNNYINKLIPRDMKLIYLNQNINHPFKRENGSNIKVNKDVFCTEQYLMNS